MTKTSLAALVVLLLFLIPEGNAQTRSKMGLRLQSFVDEGTDTIFDIRSMTKPVTVIGILILMEEGKLALNDAVELYLPEFKNSAFKDAWPWPRRCKHLDRITGFIRIYRKELFSC